MLLPLFDNNPTQHTPVVTISIIVINTLSLLYLAQMQDDQRRRFVAYYGFVPKRIAQLVNRNMVVVVDLYGDQASRRAPWMPPDPRRFVRLPPVPEQIILSLISSLFLHAGLPHLLANMWFFWIFGNNIEDRLGPALFLGFYVVGGIAASLCHWAMTSGAGATVPVIGASGAVAVMLGAYSVMYPSARVTCLLVLIIFFTLVDLPALLVLGLWFLGQLASGVGMLGVDLAGGVAWWAHIGGFVAGAVAMPILAASTPESNGSGDDEDRGPSPSPPDTPR
jgi:membrane associated rhomboid family serine protease